MKTLIVVGSFAVVSSGLIAGCTGPGTSASTAPNANAVRVVETGIMPGPVNERAQQGSGVPRTAQGMDHSAMQGMDHSSMQGMDHSPMQGMQHDQQNTGASDATSRTESTRTAQPSPTTGASPDKNAHAGHGDAHGNSAAGQPGQANAATRTIKVVALDTMRFDPQEIRVKAGETVRFDVANNGKVAHEFVIAGPDEQRAHEKMMQQMPGMKHEDANAVTLEPGERRTLVWTFTQPGTVEIGCHIPGHYPAGMKSRVSVLQPNGR